MHVSTFGGREEKVYMKIKRTGSAILHYVFKIPTQSASFSTMPFAKETKAHESWEGEGRFNYNPRYLFSQLAKISSKHKDDFWDVKF